MRNYTEEELLDALSTVTENLSPDKDDEKRPETWAEFEPHLMDMLWDNRDRITGQAFPATLRAIRDLVDAERRHRDVTAEEDNRRPLLDRIDALPEDTARELLELEIGRVSGYLKDLKAALRGIVE